MDLRTKLLVHQIHPAKLAVDWLTTPIALRYFWKHQLLEALGATFLPPMMSSAAILAVADLEPYGRSAAGRYVQKHMTATNTALRVAGLALLVAGAWWHRPVVFPIGVLVILLGWFRGLLAGLPSWYRSEGPAS